MALNRAGYKVSEEKTFPFVVIPSESNNFWQLSTHSSTQEFKSIYELILCLSKM